MTSDSVKVGSLALGFPCLVVVIGSYDRATYDRFYKNKVVKIEGVNLVHIAKLGAWSFKGSSSRWWVVGRWGFKIFSLIEGKDKVALINYKAEDVQP